MFWPTPLVISNKKQKAATEGLTKSSVNISLKHFSCPRAARHDYTQIEKGIWRQQTSGDGYSAEKDVISLIRQTLETFASKP